MESISQAENSSFANQSGSIAQAGAWKVPWITRKPMKKKYAKLISVRRKRTRKAPSTPEIAPDAPTSGSEPSRVMSAKKRPEATPAATKKAPNSGRPQRSSSAGPARKNRNRFESRWIQPACMKTCVTSVTTLASAGVKPHFR